MIRFIIFLISISYFFTSNISFALNSNWDGVEEAKVRIISPFSKIGNNSNIYLGLEYQLKDGWKTYWHSPGAGGFAQILNWEDSKNISSLEILWPKPEEFNILGLRSIGYKDEVVFPLKIQLENTNKIAFFSFEINYLTCKDICIPGQAKLKLSLSPGKTALTNHSFKIEQYLSKTPIQNNKITELEIFNVKANNNHNKSIIKFEVKSKFSLLSPKFFLGNNIGLPIVEPQLSFSSDRKNVKVQFSYDDFVFNEEFFDLSILFLEKNFVVEKLIKVKPQKLSNFLIFNNIYFYAFLISIVGGMILNFMPCVLPVLSLKLITILNHQQKNSLTSIRKSFFISAVGIISSFLILSFVLIILKISGISIGWGMQFQQPLFLMTILMVLYFFFLNLMGFFEFNIPLFFNRFLTFSFNNRSFYDDFLTGFFATVLATPCSAPFIGTAISLAFTQSYTMMFGIFFFMGFGMATPYILVGFFPKLITVLPKPGNWMKKLKFFLALLLLGTIVWIGTILQTHFNNLFLIICFILALIILISFKYFKQLKFLFIIPILLFFSLNFFHQLKVNNIVNNIDWHDLKNFNLSELKNNNIIFVDITADWCVTCQFNKLNVINSTLIQEAFIKNNIIKVRGDWTKPDKQIQEFLNNYNRFGIPFNAMYNKDYPNGIIFSELLKTSEIIDTIELMKEKKN